MTIRPILISADPHLTTPCTAVTKVDDELARLVEDLFDTNTAANGAGLAANQIGDLRRVFVYHCRDAAGVRRRGYVINPQLDTSARPETMPDPDDDLEGCLSLPGEAYPTGRAATAVITGIDLTGHAVEVEGTEELARCFQHETDHLDGHLYLDRLIGRHRRAARRMLKARGWTDAGHSWLPGRDRDPFGH